jgi:hypothetical protein
MKCRLLRNKFGTPLPTHIIIARFLDKFEADGTVQIMNKGWSAEHCSSTDNSKSV